MKNLIRSVLLASTGLLLTGCLPEQFLWWSPDGRIAALSTAEGLRLVDANGDLSPVVLSGEVKSAAWLSDGSGVVVSRSYQKATWAEVEPLLPPAEAAETMRMARAIPDLLKAGLIATGGSAGDLDSKFLAPLGATDTSSVETAFACALSLYRDQIQAVIGGFTNAAQLQQELLSSETNGITVHEIAILPTSNGHPAGELRPLLRSLRPILDLGVSPRYPVLAFRSEKGALRAMTLDGAGSVVVSDDSGVRYAAWSPDGRVLFHTVMSESDKVGEIRRRTVIGTNGQLLTNAPAAQTLAMAAFAPDSASRLGVLPDGRLLFSAVPVTLPACADAIQPAAKFFLLDPSSSNAAPTMVQTTGNALPDDLSAFVLSPSGAYVAVVEGGTDAVALLELASGKVDIISQAHSGWKTSMLPAWKSGRELTFASLAAPNATRPELLVWQPQKALRALSTSWPDSLVKPLLEGPRSGNSSEK